MKNELDRNAGIDLRELTDLYLLDGVKGFGPQKFKKLWLEQISPSDLLADPGLLPLGGKRGEKLRNGIKEISEADRREALARAERQLAAADKNHGLIISYKSSFYPQSVFESNNPIPILYVRGNPEVLDVPAVACVGSRSIRSPYDKLQASFAGTAAKDGLAVVSGFAEGADSIGHKAASSADGKTICCMPGGLDRPFPPENQQLWHELLSYRGAVFVTEFAFGLMTSSLTLRKRNKLIVAFAGGVMIGQSSEGGGAMNAYRFAREQKKPVATFRSDGSSDTSGNQHIEKEAKPGDKIFDVIGHETKEYRQWLRQLFSST